MLENALAEFLESLTERELDEPFRALLHAEGFTEIHFVHGSGEFGRDFIARREDDGVMTQYSFQNKAGDINANAFRDLRNQLEDIRTGDLSHPGFDADLPRASVLVTTGRLVGDARLASQGYKKKYAEEITFDVWDADGLLERLARSPDAAFAGVADGDLLRELGRIAEYEATDHTIDAFARRWTPAPGEPCSTRARLEAALIANRCRVAHRLDLACVASLALVRVGAVQALEADPEDPRRFETLDAGRRSFLFYSREIVARLGELSENPEDLILQHPEPGTWFTYPARCSRLLEIVGLVALWDRLDTPDEESGAVAVVQWLLRVHPGAAHPVSDRYAFSSVAAALVLAGERDDLVEEYLREVARWLGDHYEDGAIGLAPVDATAEVEHAYLLGRTLDHIKEPPRSTSLLATALLDLATLLGYRSTYDDIRSDVIAVDAFPEILYTDDSRDQYLQDGATLTHEFSMEYADEWTEALTHTSPHQPEGVLPRLAEEGRLWEQFAATTSLHDRHQYAVWKAILARLSSG